MKTTYFLSDRKLSHLALLLMLLSIVDSFLTHYGIQSGYIDEANPLMAYIYNQSIPLFFSIKISLPLLLLFTTKAIPPKRYLCLLMGTVVLIYSVVVCMHLTWITIALYI